MTDGMVVIKFKTRWQGKSIKKHFEEEHILNDFNSICNYYDVKSVNVIIKKDISKHNVKRKRE